MRCPHRLEIQWLQRKVAISSTPSERTVLTPNAAALAALFAMHRASPRIVRSATVWWFSALCGALKPLSTRADVHCQLPTRTGWSSPYSNRQTTLCPCRFSVCARARLPRRLPENAGQGTRQLQHIGVDGALRSDGRNARHGLVLHLPGVNKTRHSALPLKLHRRQLLRAQISTVMLAWHLVDLQT